METYRGRNSVRFTLIELLVVIAIIAILAAMLMPALEAARDKALQVSCLSQMHQQALGIQMYANDYDGLLPGPSSTHSMSRSVMFWHWYGWSEGTVNMGDVLGGGYIGNLKTMYCPAVGTGQPWSGNQYGGLSRGGSAPSYLSYENAQQRWGNDPIPDTTGLSGSSLWNLGGRMCSYSYRPTVDPKGSRDGWFGTVAAPLTRQPADRPLVADFLEAYDWHDGEWNVMYPDGHTERKQSELAEYEARNHTVSNSGVRARTIWNYLYED
jgi:prepilin-type N-terminal cleavage/methylation domain-containing protein